MENEVCVKFEESIMKAITRELLEKAVSNGLLDEGLAAKVNKKMSI